jgi:hypothetical protein
MERINKFSGGKTHSWINAHACAGHVKHRDNKGGAWRDPETVRAAINHHAREGFRRGLVRASLPQKGEAPSLPWLLAHMRQWKERS